MRLVVITSCTGEKSIDGPHRLTEEDFDQGPDHLCAREHELADVLRPAEELYSGQQHLRLMRGVRAARAALGAEAVSLWILSAGYGLVPGGQLLAPYDATFQGMGRSALRRRADRLGVPEAAERALTSPFDLALVLLGDDYLAACQLDEGLTPGGPVVALCGGRAARALATIEGVTAAALTNAEARRFGCALVGLKGELGGRALKRIAAAPDMVRFLGAAEPWELLDLLDDEIARRPLDGVRRRANPKAYKMVHLSPRWRAERHRPTMEYYIPEWDDLVDPDYDFGRDAHWGGTGDWANQVYAHQLFDQPRYDGILISRSVAESSAKKRQRIERLGIRHYLRVGPALPVMGDCGAFNYRDAEVPPYTTDELLDFYSRLEFDAGVSIDHLIITDDPAVRRFRSDLTIQNARDFLAGHRAAGLPWEPIGAIQGWDGPSYAAATRDYIKMGYRALGLGGLVRTRTDPLLTILAAVHEAVTATASRPIWLHLFGVARLEALAELKRLGIRSVDSASSLRQAWMRTETSYLLPETSFAALRIPEARPAFRRRVLKTHPETTDQQLLQLEAEALAGVRAWARREGALTKALTALLAYDRFVTADRIDLERHYRRTLEQRPWERCGCPICREAGVEVVIFRGNNRNRRRGFHNTHVFYERFSRALEPGPRR